MHDYAQEPTPFPDTPSSPSDSKDLQTPSSTETETTDTALSCTSGLDESMDDNLLLYSQDVLLRLMREFYRFFDFERCALHMVQHGGSGTGANHQTSSAPTSGSPGKGLFQGENPARARHGGIWHKRRNNTDDDDKDEESPEPKQLQPNAAEKNSLKRLACPYFQYDSDKYQHGSACTGPGWTAVHRVK